jgi:long-chain acyl-CoA synthetase
MNFLEIIFDNLASDPEKPILQEVRDDQPRSVTTRELLKLIRTARLKLRERGLKPGERCALLGANSIEWVALDLAIMAEGAIAVPLYHRQEPEELIGMMKDCAPLLLCCSSPDLRDPLQKGWLEHPPCLLHDEIWSTPAAESGEEDSSLSRPLARPDSAVAAIIYTSGTSGEAKGVMLNLGNISFMLERIMARLIELMEDVPREGDDLVFHYLPFCFAGSWMLLLTCLLRKNLLTLSTDLDKLSNELKIAQPHYFMNVPLLLERMRNGILLQLQKTGGVIRTLFLRGEAAWLRQQQGKAVGLDFVWEWAARTLVFSKIKQKIDPNLRALICGSAPLAEETQLFFHMLGIPVLQVYGLTETTAICTMDDVRHFTVGFAGPAIRGIEMRRGQNDEILVKGPNIFPGYWNRPEATAKILQDGWFHTGDQGFVDDTGNWKIIGRMKNLIIPTSGHNIAPEPIEQLIYTALPEVKQVMVIGNGRKYLTVILTGDLNVERIQSALDSVNAHLPHYRQVRRFFHRPEPFTPESGLLTTMGKLKRSAIEAHFQAEVDRLYE